MVRALDGAGLEVLLDVVYNHTAAGNEHGPTLCHRGLDNAGYYRLVPGDPAHYFDTTGTGNSLDLSDPVCLRMVLDSLRYWATVMHVDGFRFDLAARRRPAHPRQRLWEPVAFGLPDVGRPADWQVELDTYDPQRTAAVTAGDPVTVGLRSLTVLRPTRASPSAPLLVPP
jgi:hypothetical protein